jgi:hypothetical protein
MTRDELRELAVAISKRTRRNHSPHADNARLAAGTIDVLNEVAVLDVRLKRAVDALEALVSTDPDMPSHEATLDEAEEVLKLEGRGQ